jgi:cyclopropane-fatty-acyl-phospholipid synthase
MYMPAMACAFDRGWLSVYQVLAQKNQADGLASRPWTRRHQYLPGEPVRLSNGLDWGDL